MTGKFLPKPRLLDPVSEPPGAAGEVWWHVPVLLPAKWWQRVPRVIQVRVLYAAPGGNREGRMLLKRDVSLEPELEITLGPNVSGVLIPAIMRSPVSLEVSPSPLRGWIRFPLPAGMARITCEAAMVARTNFIDLPPGRQAMGLSIGSEGVLITARNFVVNVPAAAEGNEQFTMSPGDYVNPYIL